MGTSGDLIGRYETDILIKDFKININYAK